MQIVVVGIGYVGLSNAIILAQHNAVIAVDSDPARIAQVNARISLIPEMELADFLSQATLTLTATTEAKTAYRTADIVIVATPTDYDSDANTFDTSSVSNVVRAVLAQNDNATIVIKSTVPVGYKRDLQHTYQNDQIIFSPEFLRESKALHDNLYPSRIIVGDQGCRGATFAKLMQQGARATDILTLFTTRARPRQPNFLPIHISQCGPHILTSSTAKQWSMA
jgi:UDPglucose 6-dehydrogenase